MGDGAIRSLLRGCGFQVQFQTSCGFCGGEVGKISVLQAVRPQAVLHITGAGLCAVLVIPVLTEGVHHSLDIAENVFRVRRFFHKHAHGRPGRTQASGDTDREGPVRVCLKAHVPERAVYGIIRAVGESDFQFPRHMNLPADGEQVSGHGFGPRIHVERLPDLHAGKGTADNVPGIVSAAALGVDACGNGRFHNGGHLFRRKVMELYRLAGGELEPVHAPVLHGVRKEFQPFQCQPSAGEPEPQHMFALVPLRVTAHAA